MVDYASLIHPTPATTPTRPCPPRRLSQTRLQQITAGRRFPVEHLAGGEDAGQPADHETGIEFVERNAAGGGNRTRDRRRAVEFDRHGVDQRRRDLPPIATTTRRRRPPPPPATSRSRPAIDAPPCAASSKMTVLPRGAGQPRGEIAAREIGPQRDVQGRQPLAEHGLAQSAGQRIDRAALDARPGDHRLAAHRLRAERQRNAFQRLALKTVAENV